MTVDLTKWKLLGMQIPGVDWQPVTESGTLGLSTAVETFLVTWSGFSHTRPDYLMRSKLVLRPLYALASGDIETREIWLRPSQEPREITVDYPLALLRDGTIFRSFEARRWNRYRNGMNYDGAWEFTLYESRQTRELDLPPPPPPPSSTGQWEWRFS